MAIFTVRAPRCALALAALLAAPAAAHAAALHTQTFSAVKTTVPPPAEPSLQASVWQAALALTGFYDFNAREPARHATEVRLLYDDRNLYVSVHAEQRGVAITTTQTVDHAGLGRDDRIIVQLDTSGNGSRHYEFRASPSGVHNEFSAENARFAPRWTSLGRILPGDGYELLMVVPLSALRLQDAAAQRWRFNVIRVIAATQDVFTWAFEPTQNNLDAELNWPVLDGLRIAAHAARARPQADLYVLGSGGGDHDRYQNGFGKFRRQRTRPAGADATIPLTGTLAFVGTINPDFSNVEVDQTTVAPQEFQRHFAEYRPFFTQGASYVNTVSAADVNGVAPSLFYTPSIGVFDRGAKLEGTLGNAAVGALDVTGPGFHDAAFGFAYGNRERTFEAKLEAVGANHAGTTDTTVGYSLGRTNPRSGEQTLLSFASERGMRAGGARVGRSLNLAEMLRTQRWNVALVWRDIGPQFAPLDGFTPINDVRGYQSSITYNGAGSSAGAVKSYTFTATADRFVDRSGAVRLADAVAGASVTFKNLLTVSLNGGATELRSYGTGFPAYAAPRVTRFNQTALALGYRDGTSSPVDLSYAAGLFGANAVGEQLFTQQLTASATRALGPRFTLNAELDGTIERVAGARRVPNALSPARDGQWLRRIALSRSFGKDTSIALGLRSISGAGGFAAPGTNLALSFHRRFRNDDQLYVDYGTPAASSTLHRLIVKFVFHTGETGS